jgi:hypothetical protein
MMSKAIRYVLVTIFLSAPIVWTAESGTKSLLDLEKPGIDKIAQLSAKEHSTILFAVADHVIGYAKDGRVQWINSSHNSGSRSCDWTHAALSHDGLSVAFVSDSDKPNRCRIVIDNVPTGSQRALIETTNDPGEISWSWDDAEIAFFDQGISAVSIRDGARRLLLAFPMKKIGDREFTYGVWDPMQWLHNGRDLVVELDTEIPTKEPGTYSQQSNLLLVSGGDAHVMDIGSHPAVSPSSDRVAYYASEGVVAINADTMGKTILAKAPGAIWFGKEYLFWNIVWSPDASRLFFGTIVSETRRDNLYLLDVKSGHSEKFLSRTSITIRGWR